MTLRRDAFSSGDVTEARNAEHHAIVTPVVAKDVVEALLGTESDPYCENYSKP